MLSHNVSSFDDYLDQIERQLRDLPAERRQAIRQELRAHLEDAAAERGVPADDPELQKEVIAELGRSTTVAAGFGRVHRGIGHWWRVLGIVGAVWMFFLPLFFSLGALAGILLVIGLYSRYGKSTGIAGRAGLLLSGGALVRSAFTIGFLESTLWSLLIMIIGLGFVLFGIAVLRRRVLPRQQWVPFIFGLGCFSHGALNWIRPVFPEPSQYAGFFIFMVLVICWLNLCYLLAAEQDAQVARTAVA